MSRAEQDLFWEQIKKLIKAHKITQKKFADYIGINYNTFKNWMCYGIIPDVYSAFDIAVALGVSVEFLVTGCDGETTQNREKETLARKNAARDIRKMALKIGKDAELIG